MYRGDRTHGSKAWITRILDPVDQHTKAYPKTTCAWWSPEGLDASRVSRDEGIGVADELLAVTLVQPMDGYEQSQRVGVGGDLG